jgi:hypothetical protein
VGPYHMLGGHRLWYAPEVPRRTYLPDSDPVEITRDADGLFVQQQPEVGTGVQKSIRIRFPDDRAMVVLDHLITNTGSAPITAAPWAITQFKVGGVAILPQYTELLDPDGVLPNRSLALWPYTDITSPSIIWSNDFIFITANHQSQTDALKIGFPNPRGWLAYHLDYTLFVKYAAYEPEALYYDQNSSSECYCGPDFLELETLAPRSTILPGESVPHREVWRVIGNVDFSPTEARADELVEEFGLESVKYMDLLGGTEF